MKRIALTIGTLATMLVLATPVAGFAAGPAATPMTVMSEGFESASTRYVAAPIDLGTGSLGSTYGYWARVAVAAGGRAHTGVWGLWCDGTDSKAVTGFWSGVPLTYNPYSAGTATFDLTQTADLYSSTLDFWYTLPSRGTADMNSFNVLTSPLVDLFDNRGNSSFPLTADKSWRHEYIPIVDGLSAQIVRMASTVRFAWTDSYDSFEPAVGQGPTIDDVSVTGWRYGPVRSLTAVAATNGVTLKWSKPLRASASTLAEDRPISYRVWRAPAGTTVANSAAWTLLTPTNAANADAAISLFDSSAVALTSYTYLVQPWEPGAGTGYGMLQTVAAKMAGAASSMTFTSPTTSGFSGPATVSGSLKTATGAALAGRNVDIASSIDGKKTWKALATAVTLSTGAFSKAVAPTVKTYYRATFAGNATNASAAAIAVSAILPRVYLTTPSAPTTAVHAHAFTSVGYLRPYHGVGSYPVTIQCCRYERQSNGTYRWILRRNVAAKAYYYVSTTTRYVGSISLPYAGKWAIRAYHAADSSNAATYSTFHFLTAK